MEPDDLTFGSDGNLYISSGTNSDGKILRYDGKTGAFMLVFAKGDGSAAGLLNAPNDVLFGSGAKLYVTTQGSVVDGTRGIS